TTRGFFLTDMSCSREIVQTSLTRLFDTAVAAWSRRLLVRLPWVPRYFPWISPGDVRARLVSRRSVLSSRRPGQDKNPGSGKPRDNRGGVPGGTALGGVSARRI